MYEARLAAIQMAFRAGEHRYRIHAVNQMHARGVRAAAFRRAIAHGELEIVEDYPFYDPHNPDDRPCSLILGWVDGRAVHAVISYPPNPRVITVYWPDTQPEEWASGYRRRVRR